MQDVPHDGLVRHLGVVGVGVVNRVVLPLAHIRSERLPAVRFVRIVGLAIMLDEIRNERIRAGGVIRRIGQCQDVLVRADGESFDLAELRSPSASHAEWRENTPAASRRSETSCLGIPQDRLALISVRD